MLPCISTQNHVVSLLFPCQTKVKNHNPGWKKWIWFALLFICIVYIGLGLAYLYISEVYIEMNIQKGCIKINIKLGRNSYVEKYL